MCGFWLFLGTAEPDKKYKWPRIVIGCAGGVRSKATKNQAVLNAVFAFSGFAFLIYVLIFSTDWWSKKTKKHIYIYVYIYIYTQTHMVIFFVIQRHVYIWKFKPWYCFAPFQVQAAAKVLEAASWQRFVQQEMCPEDGYWEPSCVVATQRGCIPANMSSSKDISCNKNEFFFSLLVNMLVMCSMCRKFIAPKPQRFGRVWSGWCFKKNAPLRTKVWIFSRERIHISYQRGSSENHRLKDTQGVVICDRSQAGYVNVKELVRILGFFCWRPVR